jgi:hypothetical protein
MTVAVISDVHSIAWALHAVLGDARARGAGTFLDLGDTLDGPLGRRRVEQRTVAYDHHAAAAAARADGREDWAGPLLTGWP